MRSRLSRSLVAVVFAGLLVAPLPASALSISRGFPSLVGTGWGSFVSWAGGVLRHLFAEEGGSFDPLGRPLAAGWREDAGRP